MVPARRCRRWRRAAQLIALHVRGSGWFLDQHRRLSRRVRLRRSFDRHPGHPGLGAGYQINNYFRADVTGEYRFDSKLRAIETYTSFCAIGTCYDGYNGDAHSAVFLLNGYVDIGTWYGVTPYIGGGVGTAINTFANLTDTSYSTSGFGAVSSAKTTVNFAYAAMAGFSYSLTPNLKLDLGYRYLDMGNLKSNAINCNGGIATGCSYEVQKYRLTSNDIRLGLRYQFADVVPYARPVIARY